VIKAAVKHGATVEIGNMTVTGAASGTGTDDNEWNEVLPQGVLQ
jgi:hypothetical protein